MNRKDKAKYIMIGRHIRARRLQLGMKLKDLAAILGYKNHQELIKIEKGTRGLSVINLYEIAEALDVNIAYLLGECEMPRTGDQYRLSASNDLNSQIEDLHYMQESLKKQYGKMKEQRTRLEEQYRAKMRGNH